MYQGLAEECQTKWDKAKQVAKKIISSEADDEEDSMLLLLLSSLARLTIGPDYQNPKRRTVSKMTMDLVGYFNDSLVSLN